MDKKIELQVLNISNSQAQVGAYALVLGEVDGERQLPIIIGPAEAQATALCLKGVKAPRPLTHDLFYTCLDCRTSDAIALAVRSDCPIYIYESILDRECIRLDDDDERPAENPDKENETSDSTNINSLENALEQAIKDENYELAARLRDEINRKK